MIFFEEACQRAESDHDKDPTDAQVGSRPFTDTFSGKHNAFSGSHALEGHCSSSLTSGMARMPWR